MFKFALFVHILGVIGLFVGFGLLAAAIVGLRQATTGAAAKAVLATASKVKVISGVSSAFILLSGLYMMGSAASHERPTGWIVVALISFVAMGVLLSNTGDKETKQLQKELLTGGAGLSDALRRKAREPRAMTPLVYGGWMAFGILTLMVFQPSTAVAAIIMVVALLVAYFVSVRLGMRTDRAH